MATEKQMCSDHPNKQVIFVCVPCKLLICKHCKMADHEGHITKDVSKFATEARADFANKKKETETRTEKLSSQLRAAKSRLDGLDESISSTKMSISERGAMLKEWIDKHVKKKQDSVDHFAANRGRKELVKQVRHMERTVKQLEAEAEATAEMLTDDISDHRVCQLVVSLETPSDTTLRRSRDSPADIPKHSSHFFLPDTDFVQWKQCLRDFIGKPAFGQTNNLSHKTGLAVAHKLTCSTDSSAQVLALHVTEDWLICVVVRCQETQDEEGAVQNASGSAVQAKNKAGIRKSKDTKTEDSRSKTQDEASPEQGEDRKTLLKVYNRLGLLVQQEELPTMKRVALTSTSSGRLLLVCTYSGTRVTVTLDSSRNQSAQPAVDELKTKLFAFKRDTSTESKAKRKSRSKAPDTHKLYSVGVDSSKAAYSLQADDPQHVVADSEGEYFAVLQQGTQAQTTTQQQADQSGVIIFHKPPASPASKVLELEKKATFRPESEHFVPEDFCFYHVGQKAVLAVADSANNAVYTVDYWGKGAGQQLATLISDCPLVDKPTALTADPQGRLLLGCRGGNVLGLVPKEEVAEGDYYVPKHRDYDDSSEYEKVSSDDGDSEDGGNDKDDDKEKEGAGDGDNEGRSA